MKRLLLLPFLFSAFSLVAQRLENIRAEVIGDSEKVVITYDLNGASEGQKFKVTIYGSHNGFSTPLSLVSGDVGLDKEVTGGTGKRIEWSAKNELKDFAGDVTFELRADPVIAPVSRPEPYAIRQPLAGSTVKKKKAMGISWQGGRAGETIKLDLLKGGTVVSQIANGLSGQSYSWTVPNDLQKGEDYQVRLSADSGGATSGNFTIKKKINPLLIIAPVVVVGGVAALVAGGGGGGDDKKTIELPVPPVPE